MFSQEDAEQCTSLVSSALKFNNRSLLFVPTLHYISDRNRVTGYCSMLHGSCINVTSKIIRHYQDLWETCFKYAVQNDVGITIVPHLDDRDPGGEWRNNVRFDPEKKYNGFSYTDLVIAPLGQALSNGLNGQKLPVNFYLQGEMGATVFAFPSSYSNIARRLKTLYPDWSIGISLNYNNVDGEVGGIHAPQVKEVLNLVDTIGISAYAALSYPVTSQAFLNNITGLNAELLALGVKISPNKIFQFTEVGLGGGSSKYYGMQPASTPEEAARAPWAGIFSPYDKAKDPWQIPVLKNLRLQYHRTLLEFLENQPRISAAYLWNATSWDPQGLRQPEYRDSEIIYLINTHNFNKH